tara:strand:- start:164 stop:592 length:429 start_codon:yes stop_codon:yes gene_type:complete
MNLTPHFTLAEMTVSQTAARKGLSNEPTERALENLIKIAYTMEDVRALLGGKAISVSSGYRSIAVNKAVGGSNTSAHVDGLACDFICPAFGSPLAICKIIAKSGIKFDQLIEEGTWVHISIDPRMRQQVLTMRNGKYSMGLA